MSGPRILTDLEHQANYLSWVGDREWDALFADPGTGKTRMTLRRAMQRCKAGKIDALIVVAPNSVKTSWVAWPHSLEEGECDEVTKHLGDDDVVKGVWMSSATGKDKKCWEEFERVIAKRPDRLIVLTLNYEALLSEQFFAFLAEFLKEFRCQLSLDESTRIGEPGSRRTKRAIKLAPLARERTILTGTPILKSPMKIYSQGRFLSDRALGYTSFYPFRNRYCIMGGFEGRQIIEYRNLDELSDKIGSFAFRVRAEDCLKDMPPRSWKKHAVYMAPEQVRAYKTMRQEFFAEVDGTEITAAIVLAQMTRLQQIIGGYIEKDGEVFELVPPEQNPKMQEALDIIQDARGQVVQWFRFKSELFGMAKLLQGNGISYYEFHGNMDDQEKLHVRKSYQRGERRVLLGTASSGGIGIDEFKVAPDVIFYSNDFDTERREQTEKRNWRIGSQMHEAIRYHDILIPNTVDTKIMKVLRDDAAVSWRILKEQWREWI